MNNIKKGYVKSNLKAKEKENQYNLKLKKITNKKLLDYDKALISERQMTRRKLFEKLGKYIFKDKNQNNFANSIINTNNYNNNTNNNTHSNLKNNSKQNIYKQNQNKNSMIYNNGHRYIKSNDYNRLINKTKNKNNNYNSHKVLKQKTTNNTPVKTKMSPCVIKPSQKIQTIYLSPRNNNLDLKKTNKDFSQQNVNYKNIIINNLNDLKNIGVDDESKLMIHSERNQNNKIVFK